MRVLQCGEPPRWQTGVFASSSFTSSFLADRCRRRQSNWTRLRHLPGSHPWRRDPHSLWSLLRHSLRYGSLPGCDTRRITLSSPLLQAKHPLGSGPAPPHTNAHHDVPAKTGRAQHPQARLLFLAYMQPLPGTRLRRLLRKQSVYLSRSRLWQTHVR